MVTWRVGTRRRSSAGPLQGELCRRGGRALRPPYPLAHSAAHTYGVRAAACASAPSAGKVSSTHRTRPGGKTAHRTYRKEQAMSDSPTLLDRITEAAAALVPLADIPAAVGICAEEWQLLLVEQTEEVRLAVLRGRTQALRRSKERLRDAALRGSSEAALFILRRDFGWPRTARGRPRRGEPRPA